MKDSTKSMIIGLSLVTILVGFYSLYRGEKFLDALPSFIIGASLLGTVYFDKSGEEKK